VTEEPSGTCIVCARRDPRYPPACDLCRQRTAARLWELRDLHALLGAAVELGQSGSERVSGSREVPVPLRLEPLDLMARADQADRPLFVRGLLGLDDAQVGSLSVATVLQTRCVEMSALLDGDAEEWLTRRPDVPHMVSWLSRHLSWAWSDYPDVADLADEVTTLTYSMRALLNVSRKPIYLKDPCPSCSYRALRRDPGGGDVECGHCRRVWPHTQFERLAVVLADDATSDAA
jgi:hypothetical protein